MKYYCISLPPEAAESEFVISLSACKAHLTRPKKRKKMFCLKSKNWKKKIHFSIISEKHYPHKLFCKQIKFPKLPEHRITVAISLCSMLQVCL